MKLVMDKIKIARVITRMRIRPAVLAFEAWKDAVEAAKLDDRDGSVGDGTGSSTRGSGDVDYQTEGYR